jgi:aspartate/methionine/tyrosine aminotransferase
MDFADRVITLAPEGAYYMLGRAQALEAAGKEIIHLEVGQPDVPTFEHRGRLCVLFALRRNPGAA